TTAPGRGRSFFDIEQVYDDPRRRYPGSHYLIYDPRNRSVEDLGIPIPRDSIYGGICDPQRGVHYLLTYLRGRLYAFNPRDETLRDLGRVNQGGQCAMFLDRHGRVF